MVTQELNSHMPFPSIHVKINEKIISAKKAKAPEKIQKLFQDHAFNPVNFCTAIYALADISKKQNKRSKYQYCKTDSSRV